MKLIRLLLINSLLLLMGTSAALAQNLVKPLITEGFGAMMIDGGTNAAAREAINKIFPRLITAG